MSISEFRKKIIDSIQNVIVHNKVDLSMISKEETDKLVEKIADAVLITFDTLIGESNDLNIADDIPVEGEEDIIWKGRPFLSIFESYVLTSERIKIVTGFVSRKVENFELIRIQDIDYQQNIGERIFGLGDISIRGHDPSDPIIVLKNISKPEDVYELLRRSWLNARKKYGLQFREYM